jgi:integrase
MFAKANTRAAIQREELEKMARRRFQNPAPERRGKWWTLRVWKTTFVEGHPVRIRERVKLAIATMNVREVQKLAAEHLRPLNQGFENLGSATNFEHYIENIYLPDVKPLMASTTYGRTRGVLDNYLLPAFGKKALRDLTYHLLQNYFSHLTQNADRTSVLCYESRDKIRDVLASALRYALQNGLLVQNQMEHVRVPPDRRGRKRNKPYVTPEQFEKLALLIPEPYATMVYVAIYTGLRVSELTGLRWDDIHDSSITIDERFCRGDWGEPKSDASNATIGVNRTVIERIHRLKLLTIEVKAGNATRRYKAVKSDGPFDLVFQSVKDGKPMRDNNILSRYLKPAGRKIGLEFVNWRCLRTSHATWLKMAGADVKDAQAQMRHSRASTTLDIYQQFVPESQQKAVDRLSSLSQRVQ